MSHAQSGDRLVYTHRAKEKQKRRGRGGRCRFRLPDGSWHVYLNEAVPTGGSINHSVCCRCGHGYSELAVTRGFHCSECAGEDLMERASYLQSQGIELGASGPDRIQQRMAYGFRDPVTMTQRW